MTSCCFFFMPDHILNRHQNIKIVKQNLLSAVYKGRKRLMTQLNILVYHFFSSIFQSSKHEGAILVILSYLKGKLDIPGCFSYLKQPQI